MKDFQPQRTLPETVRKFLFVNLYKSTLITDSDIFATLAGFRITKLSEFCPTLYTCLTHMFNGPLSGTTHVSRYQKGTRSSAIAEGPRDASCQLKSCQLPRNSAETTYTTSPDQIDAMKLEIQSEAMRDRQCALNHDATVSAPIVSGVINKPTTVELCISRVYRRLAVAKFSKSTM